MERERQSEREFCVGKLNKLCVCTAKLCQLYHLRGRKRFPLVSKAAGQREKTFSAQVATNGHISEWLSQSHCRSRQFSAKARTYKLMVSCLSKRCDQNSSYDQNLPAFGPRADFALSNNDGQTAGQIQIYVINLFCTTSKSLLFIVLFSVMIYKN